MPKKKSFLDHSLFNKIDNPIVAYFLGFLWADGWVNKKEKINNFLIKINSEDGEYLKKLLPRIGKFNIRDYTISDKRFKNDSNITIFECTEKLVKSFLVENDFLIKSETSPVKILNLIPENLTKYFMRGLFDGDGNFYCNKKQGLYHFYLHGSFNQKYEAIEMFLENQGIPFKITRKTSKKGSYSFLRVVGKPNVINLGNNIYDSFETDQIGFTRKYNKFLEIKS